MSDELSIESARAWLRELHEVVARRIEATHEVESRSAQQTLQETRDYTEARALLVSAHETEVAGIRRWQAEAVEQITARSDAEYTVTEAEYRNTVDTSEERLLEETEAARQERDDTRWMIGSLLDDDAQSSPLQELNTLRSQISAVETQLESESKELEQAHRRVLEFLQACRVWGDLPSPQPVPMPTDRRELQQRFEDSAAAARDTGAALQKLTLPRLFRGWTPVGLFLLAWGVLEGIVFLAVDPALVRSELKPTDPDWLLLTGGSTFGIVVAAFVILHSIARYRSSAVCETFLQQFAEARLACDRARKLAHAELAALEGEAGQRHARAVASRENALRQAEEKLALRMRTAEEARNQAVRAAHAKYPHRLGEIEERRERELAQVNAEAEGRVAALAAAHTRNIEELDSEHARRMAALREEYERDWQAVADEWNTSLERLQSAADGLCRTVEELCPEWSDLINAPRALPDEVPAAVAIGRYHIGLSEIDDGVPEDSRLAPERTDFALPVLLPFAETPSLLLKARGAGRAAAVRVLQATMLRLLTSLPPGKVRFTIIDPVGLGENFAAFMHLADYDELLISSRIWTEPSHIEQRLGNLTETIETIFQTYLRNEFATIDDYNRQAGEVAEPYHFLVVANFPVNFSDLALRRLTSIATSGSRCGVFLLMSVDVSQPLPREFSLLDLEQGATVLKWDGEEFLNAERELQPLRLELDEPPEAEDFSRIVRAVGRDSQHSRRVEVPFERVVPPEGRLWTASSSAGIDVPLGRAGAMKLQHLRLGKGTSQHVLIAGKTGSGKSTLLHILITNAALHYGPREVEFYLIDFKKGVEFKAYAAQQLPHARVIAIESDREFGVSALERLDGILKERGELFREAGVQDLESYRRARPEAVLPRILLVIDEFQEFFVEDDALSQTASLLLDRLIRQGRAFGVHVLLGSQTLAGAYSLARSTLGQVAVRIALQCSETDSHLILSEENAAARLLTRPGEAIYNDANGLVEGNHPFQIAWLDDERREHYLSRVREHAREQEISVPPAIVFEGNVPADIGRNPVLNRMLERSTWQRLWSQQQTPEARSCWLGEAVALSGPTELAFRHQSGSNLLLVGQSADAAEGIMAACAAGLLAQDAAVTNGQAGEPSRFYVFDGSQPGGRVVVDWERLAGTVPNVRRVAPRETADALAGIADEVRKRDGTPGAPIFVFVVNLARFRDLRKSDDDFGFGGMDREKSSTPAQHFAEIVREGPSVGVHSIIWCDSYNTATRWLTRDMLRELETRVVLQMSAADSTSLIDSPAATQLGAFRALLYRGDTGVLEKFRPYHPPSPEWLDRLVSRLTPYPASSAPEPHQTR